MVDYRDIGTRIRTVRKRKQMSQKQLADKIGVGGNSYQPYRNRKYDSKPQNDDRYYQCIKLFGR